MKKNRASKNPKRVPQGFDYSKAKPNRFAARYQADRRLIMLDPDVAQVLTTATAVNMVPRALLEKRQK